MELELCSTQVEGGEISGAVPSCVRRFRVSDEFQLGQLWIIVVTARFVNLPAADEQLACILVRFKSHGGERSGGLRVASCLVDASLSCAVRVEDGQCRVLEKQRGREIGDEGGGEQLAAEREGGESWEGGRSVLEEGG